MYIIMIKIDIYVYETEARLDHHNLNKYVNVNFSFKIIFSCHSLLLYNDKSFISKKNKIKRVPPPFLPPLIQRIY